VPFMPFMPNLAAIIADMPDPEPWDDIGIFCRALAERMLGQGDHLAQASDAITRMQTTVDAWEGSEEEFDKMVAEYDRAPTAPEVTPQDGHVLAEMQKAHRKLIARQDKLSALIALRGADTDGSRGPEGGSTEELPPGESAPDAVVAAVRAANRRIQEENATISYTRNSRGRLVFYGSGAATHLRVLPGDGTERT
jgi:hypothetical protein